MTIRKTDYAVKSLSLQADEAWRQTHFGRLLGHALRKFDARVRSLMAQDDETPLALSNLAVRDKVGAAHDSHHAATCRCRATASPIWPSARA